MALPRDDKNRWLASSGCFSVEGMKRPTAHDGSDENEDNPTFSQNGEIGGVIGVRLPGGQNDDGPGVRGFSDPNTLKLVVAGACTTRITELEPGRPGSLTRRWAPVLPASAWGLSVPTPFASGPLRAAPHGGQAQPIPPPVASPRFAIREVGVASPRVARPSVLFPIGGSGRDSGLHAPAFPRFSRLPESKHSHSVLPHAAMATAPAGRGLPWALLTSPGNYKPTKSLEFMHKGHGSLGENSGPTPQGRRAPLSRAGLLIGTLRQPRGPWATWAAPPLLGPTRRLLRGLRSTGRSSRCLLGVR